MLSQAVRETSLTKCLDFNQWCRKLMLVLKMKTVTVYSSAGNTVSFKNQNLKKETGDTIWQLNPLQCKSIRMMLWTIKVLVTNNNCWFYAEGRIVRHSSFELMHSLAAADNKNGWKFSVPVAASRAPGGQFFRICFKAMKVASAKFQLSLRAWYQLWTPCFHRSMQLSCCVCGLAVLLFRALPCSRK